MRNQWVTGAAALSIQRDAMRVDPDAAADVVAILETRARGLFEVVRPLGPHLKPGLTVKRAHDLLLALTVLEIYLELQERGWSGDAYEEWLAGALRAGCWAGSSRTSGAPLSGRRIRPAPAPGPLAPGRGPGPRASRAPRWAARPRARPPTHA